MLSSTLNFYLLVPYHGGGGVYTSITRRNCKCQMQIAHLIFRYVFTICKFLFFISGERTQVIIMFFCTDFHLHLRGIRNFYFLFYLDNDDPVKMQRPYLWDLLIQDTEQCPEMSAPLYLCKHLFYAVFIWSVILEPNFI